MFDDIVEYKSVICLCLIELMIKIAEVTTQSILWVIQMSKLSPDDEL